MELGNEVTVCNEDKECSILSFTDMRSKITDLIHVIKQYVPQSSFQKVCPFHHFL